MILERICSAVQPAACCPYSQRGLVHGGHRDGEVQIAGPNLPVALRILAGIPVSRGLAGQALCWVA